MPFTCICDRQSEVAILRCAGSIVVGDDTDYFHRAMADAAVAAQGIVVDLERVTYVDSSGLGSLIRACNIQTVQRRPVAFLKPSKRVLELIRLTGVDKVLKLFDDEPAAVQHAGGPARAAGASTAGGTPILCVEPDPPMQACLTALLEAGGFKVTAVRSAYDARMMGSSGADLVVLGPGLNADAKAAARSTLARAKHFVNVPPEFAAEQSEEAMRKLVSEVAAAAGRS